jgi:hypothetical protein
MLRLSRLSTAFAVLACKIFVPPVQSQLGGQQLPWSAAGASLGSGGALAGFNGAAAAGSPASSWPQAAASTKAQEPEHKQLIKLSIELTQQFRFIEAKAALAASAQLTNGGEEVHRQAELLRWRMGLRKLNTAEIDTWLGWRRNVLQPTEPDWTEMPSAAPPRAQTAQREQASWGVWGFFMLGGIALAIGIVLALAFMTRPGMFNPLGLRVNSSPSPPILGDDHGHADVTDHEPPASQESAAAAREAPDGNAQERSVADPAPAPPETASLVGDAQASIVAQPAQPIRAANTFTDPTLSISDASSDSPLGMYGQARPGFGDIVSSSSSEGTRGLSGVVASEAAATTASSASLGFNGLIQGGPNSEHSTQQRPRVRWGQAQVQQLSHSSTAVESGDARSEKKEEDPSPHLEAAAATAGHDADHSDCEDDGIDDEWEELRNGSSDHKEASFAGTTATANGNSFTPSAAPSGALDAPGPEEQEEEEWEEVIDQIDDVEQKRHTNSDQSSGNLAPQQAATAPEQLLLQKLLRNDEDEE